ncbi:MAG: protein kinase, partial [Ignavibacteriae bacterium]|nr:protein kinase [Ignavibacteriota bacterium]
MIGKIVTHYKILERLGGGGMGLVYKAQDLTLDRSVALKFLPPVFSMNEDLKLKIIQEAKIAATLEHPNICNIHEVGETEDGKIFIVMAYYKGETLKKVIQN